MKIPEFEKLKNDTERLNGVEASFNELFSKSFMRKYTSFSSIDEFFNAGGFHIESLEDLDAVPDDELDKHIVATTKFRNWKDMRDNAIVQFMAESLGI